MFKTFAESNQPNVNRITTTPSKELNTTQSKLINYDDNLELYGGLSTRLGGVGKISFEHLVLSKIAH